MLNFIKVSLLIFIAIFQTSNANLGRDELIQIAIKEAAPFVQQSLNRLFGDVFGSKRGTRSTDAVIRNKTKYRFKLYENSCQTGGWTSSLLPVDIIEPHSSVAYGAESYGFMTGATNYRVKYSNFTSNGPLFDVTTWNPFAGRARSEGSGFRCSVQVINGRGSNN